MVDSCESVLGNNYLHTEKLAALLCGPSPAHTCERALRTILQHCFLRRSITQRKFQSKLRKHFFFLRLGVSAVDLHLVAWNRSPGPVSSNANVPKLPEIRSWNHFFRNSTCQHFRFGSATLDSGGESPGRTRNFKRYDNPQRRQ